MAHCMLLVVTRRVMTLNLIHNLLCGTGLAVLMCFTGALACLFLTMAAALHAVRVHVRRR